MKEVSEQILECCQDRHDYPAFFEIGIGKDFRLETMPEVLAEIREPREVTIELSTFRGVSIGAIHYYAKIRADGIHLYEYRKGDDGNLRCMWHRLAIRNHQAVE